MKFEDWNFLLSGIGPQILFVWRFAWAACILAVLLVAYSYFYVPSFVSENEIVQLLLSDPSEITIMQYFS